ncbi:MAG TPA: thymidine kinase [Candidatus Lambdaproteobacteria bacterium]|nr:thymidine kinase [Deltaproteobacteria bacterium]HIA57905.1 thymidine kinase [Candidatus Lambdaproteobacteria bacterium]HIB46075.1 thymidine kinase [Candidatus Lambdaproteobacteria bacterium]HIB94632.1 thymidine kinase [Candidatus Lambdaproteobacteria bacterium]HIN46789.1 thymidine kinase [Deltaproteobacteria bacterium]
MAKLYFYYSAMNAGKTTTLLQSAYNYRERGMNTLVLKPSIDDRHSTAKVRSRIGLEADAVSFRTEEDLLALADEANRESPLSCVLLDEAQFLTKTQVFALGEVVDKLGIPVLAYGLRTDFKGKLFEGSLHLLAWADELMEIKTVCHCGKKATMVLRLDQNGVPLKSGEQIQIGGNDSYVSVCRKHFKSAESTNYAT